VNDQDKYRNPQDWLNAEAVQIRNEKRWERWEHDSHADHEFFEASWDWAYSVARSFVRGLRLREDDLKDVAQDTTLNVRKYFRSFQSRNQEAQYTTWLHQIVKNECLDRARAGEKLAEVNITDDNREFVEKAALQNDIGRPHDVQYEEHDRVEKLLKPLSERDAEMLWQWADQDPPELIAERVGMSVAAVKARIYRALERLAGAVGTKKRTTRKKRTTKRSLKKKRSAPSATMQQAAG